MVARRVTRRIGSGKKKGFWPFLLGCFLITAALAALAALAYLWVFGLRADKIDEATLCPEFGPVGKLSILLDMTDSISATQRTNIIELINREVESATVGTRVTLGVVSPDDALSKSYGLSLCKPLDGENANQFYQNPRLIEQRFREGFINPLNEALDLLLKMESASTSPIMESLQFMIARSGGGTLSLDPQSSKQPLKHRLIVISDLLQHSDAFSFYRGERWEDLVQSRTVERIGRNLEDAEVLLLSIPRPDARVAEPLEIYRFWAEYFDLQGADILDPKIIGDL